MQWGFDKSKIQCILLCLLQKLLCSSPNFKHYLLPCLKIASSGEDSAVALLLTWVS